MLESEHFPRSTQTGLNLVTNEKCTVFAAELQGAGEEISSGRFTTFALDRFDDEGGNITFREFALERRDIIESDACVPLIHQRPETFREAFAAHQRRAIQC